MSRILYLWTVMVVGMLSPPALATNPTVSLEIDVSALPEDEVTEALVVHIVANGTETLETGGIDVVDDADTRLMVTVIRFGEHDVHYRTTVVLLGDGDPVERTVECKLCRDSELVEQIGKEIARLSGRMLYAAGEPRDADDKPPETIEAQPVDVEPETSDTKPPRRLGLLGKIGIGTLAGGVVSLTVGVPLAMTPDEARITANAVEERTTRPTGLALVGVGSMLLVTGVAFLVIDAVRMKKARTVSLNPSVSPSRRVFSMGVRF